MAAPGQEEISNLFDGAAQDVYRGNLGKGDMPRDLYMALAQRIFSGFKTGYQQNRPTSGITYDMPDNVAMAQIRNNIFHFSGAKSLTEMELLRDKVYEGGKLVPESEFTKFAKQLNDEYNLNYLQAERQAVIKSGNSASKWMQIEAAKKQYPYLEYRTVGDNRVRDEHERLDGIVRPVSDPFWRDNMAPNGYRCRCSVRQVSRREVDSGAKQLTDPKVANRTGQQNVDPFWRGNPGINHTVFDRSHPYFEAFPGRMEPRAVENYGMKSASRIYNRPDNLSSYQPGLESVDDLDRFWREQSSKSKAVGDGSFTVPDPFGLELLLDQKLKQNLVNKERYGIARETTKLGSAPDEMWLNNQGQQVFIRYYEDRPVVMVTNNKNRVTEVIKLNSREDVEQYRKGLLMHRK